MKPLPRAILLLATLAVVAGCVRLGVWQLSRRAEKHRVNEALQAALAAPPLDLGDSLPRWAAVGRRVVAVRGHFDERRQILLAGREHEGQPGVQVVTPFVTAGGVVLVNRGWLPAQVPTEVHPEIYPEPGVRVVRALPESLSHRGRGALTWLPGDSTMRYLGLALNADSLAERLPYPIADVVLHELPGPGVPATPLRTPPEPLDETMHLSYAIQWFAFAAVILGGGATIAVRGLPRAAPARPIPRPARR